MSDPLVDKWRQIIIGSQKSWVLFHHGTCVILANPQQDIAAQATAIMKQWGPVHAGSSAGDFTTISLNKYPGWVVAGHHKDMLNYVSPDELEEKAPSDVAVGLLGRSKRNQDGEDPQVRHIEDKRNFDAQE